MFMAEFDIGSSERPLLDHEDNSIYLDVEEEEDHGSTIHGFNHKISTGSSIQSNVGLPLSSETESCVHIDAQEDTQNGVQASNHQRDMVVERIFLIANFLLELPSAVFDQLSSVHKPQFALISMVMSLLAMVLSIIDLADKGRRERVGWMVRGYLPWFYSPHLNHKPLGTFADIVGLVCCIFQWVFATIAFSFMSHDSDNPTRFSVWPIIFAFGALCSRFPRNPPTRDVVCDSDSTGTHQSSCFETTCPEPSPLKDLRDLQLLELGHLPIPCRGEGYNLREYICSETGTRNEKKVGRNGRKNRRRRKRSKEEREILQMSE